MGLVLGGAKNRSFLRKREKAPPWVTVHEGVVIEGDSCPSRLDAVDLDQLRTLPPEASILFSISERFWFRSRLLFETRATCV